MALLQQSFSRPSLAVRLALNEFASARSATISPFWPSFKHARISGIVVAIISGTRTVSLVDVVPKHIDQAKARQSTLTEATLKETLVGDARSLPFVEHSFDCVLMHGPLYR
jgi:Methyltransferase domain